MSSSQSGEGAIRKHLIEADLVDCMVALPGQLFYSTQIHACLWFLARDRRGGGSGSGSGSGDGGGVSGVSGGDGNGGRSGGGGSGGGGGREGGSGGVGSDGSSGGVRFRDRRGEILFIDARKPGRMVDRIHRELTDEDVTRIAGAHHAWRGERAREDEDAGGYADMPGFCKSTALGEVLRKVRPVVVVSRNEMNRFLDTVVVCPLTSTLHPQWRSRLQVPCAGKTAEIAVDRIRTIGKQRLRRRLDRLSSEHAAQLRRIITEMYGE